MSTRILATVRVTDNLPNLKAALKLLVKKEVVVGWPQDKNEPRDGDELNNATIAYINDKGSAIHNLAPQPILEPAIEEGQEKIVRRLRDAGEDALDGNDSAMDKNFTAAGVEAVSAVRNKIDVGPWKELADSTIAQRRREGFMGTKRYQRTGQLRNAVNFTVRNRKG